MPEIADNTTTKLRGGITGKGFLPGDEWNGNALGRPKGSVSIKDAIRQHLQDNPNEFKELCTYYLRNTKMRELLWKMLDGNPDNSQVNLGIQINNYDTSDATIEKESIIFLESKGYKITKD